jgi:hypothetical protein
MKGPPERLLFRLSPGGVNANNQKPKKPVISFWRGDGRRMYLWIGDDEAGPAFATLSGPKTLERLARAILAEMRRRKPQVAR